MTSASPPQGRIGLISKVTLFVVAATLACLSLYLLDISIHIKLFTKTKQNHLSDFDSIEI